MTMKVFVLIETAVGKIRDVTDSLQRLEGIQTVDVVTGPYDVIAVVSADDMNAVGRLITESMHTISGVVRTVTCVSVGS